MRFDLPIALGFALVLCLTGCSGSPSTETRSDPHNRISYELPAGWTEMAGSSGTRFAPPGQSVHIQVNTVDHSGRSTIEEERDAWLAHQRKIGAEIVHEATRDANGFHIVEFANTGENALGSMIQHQVLMQRGDFKVAAYLMAGPGEYESALPVFREVLDSIRVIESE